MSETTVRPQVTAVEVEPRDDNELAIGRLVDASAETLYRCWTDPALLAQWFCPKPWRAEVLEMDVRAGGAQRLQMRGPDGESHPSGGVYLELVPGRKIVFTNALAGGWRPAASEFPFVGEISFEPQADGRTLYVARAAHWDAATAQKHRDMGFYEGWGVCAVQMAELAATL